MSGLLVGLLSMGMAAALATAVRAAEGEFDPSEYSRGYFECYRDGFYSVTGEMATKVGLPPLASFGVIDYETGCMRGFNEGVRDGDLRNGVVKAAKAHPDFPPDGFEESVVRLQDGDLPPDGFEDEGSYGLNPGGKTGGQ